MEVASPELTEFLDTQGHALVLGGPGAGKTTAALLKARRESEAGQLTPGQRILFLSFARATVARVTERAAGLIPKEVRSLWASPLNMSQPN